MFIGLITSMLGLFSREIFFPKHYITKTHIRNAILNNPKIGLIYLDNNHLSHSNLERKSYYKDILMNKKVYKGAIDYNTTAFSLEHIFPVSFLRANPSSRYDFHNIFMTKAYINMHRSNYRFWDEKYISFSSNILRDLWKIYPDTSSLSLNNRRNLDFFNYNYKSNTGRIFFPNHSSRGKIARTLAYMKFVYPELNLNHVIDERTLINWHRNFPVSEEEFERNEVIKEIQGNTNPFVDGTINIWSKL